MKKTNQHKETVNNIGGSSLFSQILSLVDRNVFRRLVARSGSEKRSKGFSSWDHFVSMLFCQMAQAKSLREINAGLRSCEGKLRHLGMKEAPGRSTLSYANAHRPAELFEALFHELFAMVSQAAPRKKFRFKSKLYSLDSTVIDLCASMFDWAKFRASKGAAKLHLLLDHDGCLPCFATITERRVRRGQSTNSCIYTKGELSIWGAPPASVKPAGRMPVLHWNGRKRIQPDAVFSASGGPLSPLHQQTLVPPPLV